MWMTFGKHKGTLIDDIPTDYLAWCLNKCTNMDQFLRHAIQSEVEKRNGYKREEQHEYKQKSNHDISVHPGVIAWKENWRKVIFLAHPDRGGNEDLCKLLVGINLEMQKGDAQ